MKITREEQEAIRTTLSLGERFGYGNLISHLQTAWVRMLMREYSMDETAAREVAGPGMPFAMQDDLVERGFWDETGKSYREQSKA